MPTDPTRGLLVAIFAIHLDFITRDHLAAAVAEWIRTPDRPIAEILLEHRALDHRTRSIVEDVVARHLERHGGDPERSIADLGAKGLIPPPLSPAFGGSPTADGPPAAAGNDDRTEACDPLSLKGYASGGTRYRMLRPENRGGMGEVFVARDLELGRDVLLKQLPERRADEPRWRAAFLKEVRAGAALEHPNIAPVYDLGQYPGGRLFEVMRLIPGGTFERAIRDHHASRGTLREDLRGLRFRELLGHFVDACQAIEYAHSRGVLHRDIKPGNIMLGSFGETQVIDWGLARVAGHDLSDGGGSAAEPLSPHVVGEGSHPTLDGEFKGTPSYASPEQAVGRIDRVDARSDVYGLGATLYCLLTGEAPFHAQSPLLMDDVRRGRFPRPRVVRGDVPAALESICLKAMAHAPADRYPSPRALAGDIERWLADEPVLAHPDPFPVRVRRWALRHRTVVAAAAALLLTSVVGLGIGYAAVKSQRDVALDNATLAKDVVGEFLLDYSNDVLPAIPRSETKRLQWAERAVAVGRVLATRFPEDPGLAKGLARAILESANIRRSVDIADGTADLYGEATRSFDRLLRLDPADEDLQTWLLVSRCDQAAFARDHGALPEAERLARETVAIADGLPESPAVVASRSRARWDLACLLVPAGKRDEACRWMEESCRSYAGIAALEGASVEARAVAVLIHAEAARMFRDAGRSDEARRYSEVALSSGEALAAAPEAAGLERNTVRQVMAEALREWASDQGDDTPTVLDALDRAIAITEDLVAEHPTIIAYRRLLVGTLVDRAECHFRQGRLESAAADAARGIGEGEMLLGPLVSDGEPPADDRAAVARARDVAARIAGASGRPEDGERSPR